MFCDGIGFNGLVSFQRALVDPRALEFRFQAQPVGQLPRALLIGRNPYIYIVKLTDGIERIFRRVILGKHMLRKSLGVLVNGKATYNHIIGSRSDLGLGHARRNESDQNEDIPQ